MAKKIYTCEDCGKKFPAMYQFMLHADFHVGEPVVREMGCFCSNYYDVRAGFCHHCGYIHNAGWAIIKKEEVSA